MSVIVLDNATPAFPFPSIDRVDEWTPAGSTEPPSLSFRVARDENKPTWQTAPPAPGQLEESPVFTGMTGVDSSGSLYPNTKAVKASFRCKGNAGLAKLLEMQTHFYSLMEHHIGAWRPGQVWKSTPFIADCGDGYYTLYIKFPKDMQVRVLDANDLAAEPTYKYIWQVDLTTTRLGAAPFTLSRPWAMESWSAHNGEPFYGATLVSAQGVEPDFERLSDEEKRLRLPTVIANVPYDGVAGASARPAQASPKKRKIVHANLGDL